jgi:hypothetical protein
MLFILKLGLSNFKNNKAELLPCLIKPSLIRFEDLVFRKISFKEKISRKLNP